MRDELLEIIMNAQVQPRRPIADDPVSRSSARLPHTARAIAQSSPPLAEDRSLSSETQRRVNPLWMITGAAALLFVFLAMVASS
jgi:hypothetical protein